MKKLIAAAVAPLMLVACADASAPEDPDVQDPAALNEEAEAEQPAISEPDLSGEFLLTQVNQGQIPSVYDMIATFDDEGFMTIASQCVRLKYQLNRTGGNVTPEKVPGGGCDRRLTDGERYVDAAIPDMNILIEMGDGLMMTGTSGNISMDRR
ncbi:hypothetical protein [Sphingomicrobium sediminis]|uniref:Uncharacterized protein n=1 Tax=Sphingomicrobium sediminis TaxID=2950949 RepID=A0A9X2J491_9SPHN|nr:hypothetical protein [Sphingomicrobium sediminis]MCM8558116.1 hypothetical protein [Sphingomicrobium sediminis]